MESFSGVLRPLSDGKLWHTRRLAATQLAQSQNKYSDKNEFERKKQEMLAAQSASTVDGETNSAGQPAQVKWISRCNLLMGRKKEDSKVLASWLQNERHKNKRMRKELDLLMKHVYKKSSSNDERSSQEDNQTYEDESDEDFDNVNESDFNPGNVNESDFVPDGW
ncbi:hypothetical protein P3S68_000650 [Capsicum galapagoense]